LEPSTYPYDISETALLLGRQPATVRNWDHAGKAGPTLPEHLRSRRTATANRARFWTRAQIEAIRAWLVDANVHQGSGLPHVQIDSALAEQDMQQRHRQLRARQWRQLQQTLSGPQLAAVAALRAALTQQVEAGRLPCQVMVFRRACEKLFGLPKPVVLHLMGEVFDSRGIVPFYEAA